jgi:hypothetical protein
MAETDQRIDRLYGLPPDEFTSARDRLAAELQEEGDRDAATRVKKLRRPTVSAWTVNQLVRNHRGELQELLSVGEDVRAAQRAERLAGGAEAIRELNARRRRAVDRLLDLSEQLLAQGGHGTSRATLDKVGETLTAATMDEEAAENVRAGRLERELVPPSGFDALAWQTPSPAKVSARERQARDRAQRAKNQALEAEEAAEEADREARHLERQAERMADEAKRARRRADRAGERARELRRKAENSLG